jgi:hypothetical protein
VVRGVTPGNRASARSASPASPGAGDRSVGPAAAAGAPPDPRTRIPSTRRMQAMNRQAEARSSAPTARARRRTAHRPATSARKSTRAMSGEGQFRLPRCPPPPDLLFRTAGFWFCNTRRYSAPGRLSTRDDDAQGTLRPGRTSGRVAEVGCHGVGHAASRALVAVRRAVARIVSAGLNPPFVTCTEPSATKRLSWP